jgi:hypothetical protein
MEVQLEDLTRKFKDLDKRLSELEANLQKQPPIHEEMDEKYQCWGCGELYDEGVVHKCLIG